ncbi:MAG: hypothetical protein ACJ8H8_10725 [Geminicoccaceae bacterium]
MTDDSRQRRETTGDPDASLLNGALRNIVALTAHLLFGDSQRIHEWAVEAQRLRPEDHAGRRAALEKIKERAEGKHGDVYKNVCKFAEAALKKTDPASSGGSARS